MEDMVILCPAPGMGHLIAMVELGKLLQLHFSGKFSVTIFLTTGPFDTPTTDAYIHRISQAYPSISFHRFPFLSVDTTVRRSWAAMVFDFIHRNATNVLNSIQEISKNFTVKALIIDFFCGSALSIGKELGIPTYYFFTSGAACTAAFLFFPKIHEQTEKSFKDLPDTVLEFPGLPAIKATHMPEPLLDRNDPAYNYMVYFCSEFAKSDGILVNTFEELEPMGVSTIATGTCVPDGTTPPVYCIGPLIAEPDHGTNPESQNGNECLKWLQSQPNRSVVFLCFGSRGTFSPEQLTEIAYGLENSGHRFLWVVKPPDYEKTDVDLNLLMPEGFLERIEGRGMVVSSWAPQVAILKQEAVAGFVTHCGWNSVLEAVVAGVPMVAWPLYAEQHLNRGFLVEQMKMAILVEEREEDGFVTRTELEKRVRELLESENGKALRERSEKMKETAMAVFGNSGSSALALSKFVATLLEAKNCLFTYHSNMFVQHKFE